MLLPPPPSHGDTHDPPRTSRNKAWPCELTERLKKLWQENMLSASQVAQKLGITRNAVLGKANRLRLPTHKAKTSKGHIRKPVKKPKPVAVAPIGIIDEPVPAEPEFLGLTLMELSPASCRFPRGDKAPFEYCGQMQQDGSRYCRFHHQLAYLSVSSRPKFAIPAPWVDYRGGRV